MKIGDSKMKVIIGIFIALLALALLAFPALAQLGISPDTIDVPVSEGHNSLPSINVGNGSDKPVDFKVEVVGYGQGVGGSSQGLEPDTNPLSAVSYIKFDPAEFHLKPGEKQSVDLTAYIPEGTQGGRYAILLVVTSPKGEEAVKTVSRLGVLIRLTIAGSHFDTKGSIKLVEAGRIEPNKPIPIKVTYANEGNVHYKVQSSATISNAQGDILGKVVSKSALVLPGYSRELVAEWAPDHELQLGTYNMLATVSLEDGTEIATATGSFEIKPYVPPAPVVPGAPSPTPAPGAGVNWTLIVGVVAVVIIIGLLIYIIAVRRRGY